MVNCVLCLCEGLMPGHNTSAQANAASYQANCYCARWTPSFYQLPSSQANYPIPPCLCLTSALIALITSCCFAVSREKQQYRLRFKCSTLKLDAFVDFSLTDTLNKLTSALVREDVALLIV